MATGQPDRSSFQFTVDTAPSERLIAGFSSFGAAGLTAVDFLIDQLDMDEIGHVSTGALPSITPFQSGTPRHHTRLFSRSDLNHTLLINELFVPLWAADSFGKSILDWTDDNGVEEITILSGVPVPHGPEDHNVFYVATEDYQEHQLADTDIKGMNNGFLDGVNASLISRGMDSELRVGVFVTPVHSQVPDVEAALRLIEAVETMYDIDIDTSALEQFAGEVEQYYRELEERLETATQKEIPEDRMYM